MSAWSVKPDVLRSDIVGMQGSMVVQITAMHDVISPLFRKGCVVSDQLMKVCNKKVRPPSPPALLSHNTNVVARAEAVTGRGLAAI